MPLIRLLVILPFFLGSCASRIPEPISYTYSQQQKMQASHHWEVLAADLANRINNELILTDNIDKAVFVKETCGDESVPCGLNETSSFNEAFRDLLITHLVGFGIPTRNQMSEATLQILYKVQTVRHTANRARSLQPGLLTGLSAAIVVLRNAPSELIILATGAAADVANSSLTFNEHFEVLITTSIVKGHEYVFRASDIYYINDKDFWHYQNQLPQTKTIKLTGARKAEAETSMKPPPETVVIEPAPLPPPASAKKDI